MTAGRTGTGVETRGSGIRVTFTYRGKRARETLAIAATPKNIVLAEKLVQRIRQEIAYGIFDYAKEFPNSKFAKEQLNVAKKASTLADACALFLETKGRLAPATQSQYKNALNFWQNKLGSDLSIADITHGKVAAVVGSHPWSSAKLCNNYLIPLRGVFALAGRDIKGLDNPLDGIENAKSQKPPPDPLEISEMERILKWINKKNHEVANYFEFAFLTGLRPEELIELRWGDIDFAHGTALVSRAKTFKGGVKGVKTYAVRDVDLVERALAVLQRQKLITFMKMQRVDEQTPTIFQNPITQKSWHDERSQRDHYWQPALRALGIRSRRPYQTRHTYATTALMAGVNPAYISRQMGHKTAKMLFDTYSKWLDLADKGREKAKMEAVLRSHSGLTTTNLPQICPNSETDPSKSLNLNSNFGRHDWTRTNDPYHVKVVL